MTIEATGEPEPEPARLVLIATTLRAIACLASFREPSSIPPFSMLEALTRLTRDHKLRPKELTFVFRLAGPAEKYRWTYALTPTLSDRELAILEKIAFLRQRAANARFDQYESIRERDQRPPEK